MSINSYTTYDRDDLLTAFHEYVYAQADFYMNYTGREESTETARTCMSEISGAARLVRKIAGDAMTYEGRQIQS